jgi:LuxR family quorum sensing-dependent transcriptional regulator
VISDLHRNLALDAIEEMSRLQTVPSVVSVFQDAMESFGFTAMGINALPRPGEGADPLILAERTPSGFRETYIEERFYDFDHICAHARVSYEPFRYCEAPYPQSGAHGHRRFADALTSFRMGSGLIVPIGRPGSLPACIWLAGRSPDLHEEILWLIQTIALFAANKVQALSRSQRDKNPKTLTERQKEVVRWVGEGKSAWEIGVILNISKRTVDEHAKQAALKLNAATRPQLVVNAIRAGEIEL